MSKKRGLSLEEKKAAVLGIFHETQDVFQLKDIEKLAPKRGVIQQSVKEVVQALVDDDLVCQDRIGISNFLWSFPAAAGARAAAAADAAEAALAAARARTAELESALAAASAGKASGPDRDAALACLAVAEGLVSEAKAGLEAAAAGDPAKLAALAEAAAEARAAANRWLDNVHALKAWCGSKFGEGRGADLDAFFEAQGLTEAVDYL